MSTCEIKNNRLTTKIMSISFITSNKSQKGLIVKNDKDYIDFVKTAALIKSQTTNPFGKKGKYDPQFDKEVLNLAIRLRMISKRYIDIFNHNSLNISPISVEESIQDDHLICLEDGKKVIMIKRYLTKFYGMDFNEYKQKWGLPDDYPSVPPNLSHKRKEVAAKSRLGYRRRKKHD